LTIWISAFYITLASADQNAHVYIIKSIRYESDAYDYSRLISCVVRVW